MALTLLDGPPGPPWQRRVEGALDSYVVVSECLAANPLGDPAQRPLFVYRAPGIPLGTGDSVAWGDPVPVVYVLQAFLNQVDRWFNRETFEPTLIERLDAIFVRGEAPPAIVVLADAWTSLGGAQFINSAGIGAYSDYLCDEIVPFVDARYRTRAEPAGRGVAGHSSGGYGALTNAMLRPDVFGAVSARAPDALFEVSFLPDFPRAARALRDGYDGSVERFLEAFAARERFDYGRFGTILTLYAAAASFSPDADGRPELPFDPRTGAVRARVFDRWLDWDPVRLAPRHAGALRGLVHLHLEAGRRDEAHLDLGAQALADAWASLGVEHRFELFDGGHGGTGHRLPAAIADMLRALTRA